MHWPATVADIRLEPEGRFAHEFPGDHAAFIYVLDGDVHVGEEAPLSSGEVAWFDAGRPGVTRVALSAVTPSRVFACSSAPIHEPIVTHGPFVMNTREEIYEAIRAYQRGEFGPIPA